MLRISGFGGRVPLRDDTHRHARLLRLILEELLLFLWLAKAGLGVVLLFSGLLFLLFLHWHGRDWSGLLHRH